MKIVDITWETDGLEPEELGLPAEVELPKDIDADDDDAINDFLSDTYGWLVIDYFKRGRYEVYDHNYEVIDTDDDLQMAQTLAYYDDAKFIYDVVENKVVWGSN